MANHLTKFLAPARHWVAASRFWKTGLGEKMKSVVKLGGRPIETNLYGPHILWEFPIQLSCRDFVRDGDTVLDVGANIGGLSVALSRLVGSAGKVHAFEANPETLRRLRHDLAANAVENVRVVDRAAWHTSREKLTFYCDDSYYAAESGITCRNPDWRKITVKTISLDDYCRENDLRPSLIKIDVEGAEQSVLRGAETLLREQRPVVIFEYKADFKPDEDPCTFLKSMGWTLYDVYLYQSVDREFYRSRFNPLPLVNIVAIPPEGNPRADYAVARLFSERRLNFAGGVGHSGPITLARPGRYLLATKLTGRNGMPATLKLTGDDGEVLAWIECPFEHLSQHSCSNILVETDRRRDVICEVLCAESGGVSLVGIDVSRVDVPRDTGRVNRNRAA